jgi:NTP pyrophosphatase (non-canonical NTP hydrolase)
MAFDNGLSAAQTERLALFIEECGEALQVAGKTLRHGYMSSDPTRPDAETNQALLVKEVGDVLVAIDFLIDSGDISGWEVEDRKRVKNNKIWEWLHHQRDTTT